MKVLIAALIISIWSGKSNAGKDGEYDKKLIQGINYALDELASNKQTCSSLSINSSRYQNCSQSEIKTLVSHEKEIYDMLTTWLERIKKLEKDGKTRTKTKVTRRAGQKIKIRKQVSELTPVMKVLKCMISKLPEVKFACHGKNSGPCSSKDSRAITWPLVNTPINLCPDFWTTGKHESKFDEMGAILHETSHKCGTVDAAYFNVSKPRDVGLVPWHMIADTYEYWMDHNLCIPDVDC